MNDVEAVERNSPAALAAWCRKALSMYLDRFPGDAGRLTELRDLLETDLDLRSRGTFPGHVTASAFVLSPDLRSVLLIHHRALDRWLQPGGHLEAGEFPLEGARREAAEEVGLTELDLIPAFDGDPEFPLDIDSHAIPASAKKSEPAHTHHDFRYAFTLPKGNSEQMTLQLEEVHAVAWRSLDGPEGNALPASISRAVERLVEFRNSRGPANRA